MRHNRHVPALGRLLAATICTLLWAGTSWAQGDAGIRSVFSAGAGNRALALGSAYAAIADDPSAMVWNPGGLGLVSRQMLAASYSSLYLGFSEQYAAWVLPSWRFGTFGVCFQQFSVDGIEVRDDRNFRVGGDAAESQTQLSFAYGRRFGTDWSLGTALKVRRQSLAGYADTGFGIDAGVVVRPARALGLRTAWAERVSAGLTVHNALEPAIRLDEVSVPDPATVRMGLSYWLPIQARNTLLVATDLEKTSDMDVRLHVGVEARLHGALALRGGYNGLRTTTGMGVQWRDLNFDYVFENNRIEDVHRLGAAFQFGMSVDASRLAAQRAAEDAIEVRLAAEFEHRHAEQIATVLRQAEAARHAQEYDEALDLVSTVRVLDPLNREGLELEVACHRDRAQRLEQQGAYAEAALAYRSAIELQPGEATATAGEVRCRNLSDRTAARTQEIRQRFAASIDAFSAEDFATARRGFREILELNPDDAEAGRMLERTENAIRRRTLAHLELANRLVRDGVLREAENLVVEVRALDPDAKGLDALARRLRAARRAEAAAKTSEPGSGPAAGPAPPAPSPSTVERRAEIADLYKRGLAARQEGRDADAVRYWELVWSFDPDYERVREHLRREYTTRGMERFARGDLNDAIQQWQSALRVDPNDERVLAYLSRAQEQLARTRQILGGGD